MKSKITYGIIFFMFIFLLCGCSTSSEKDNIRNVSESMKSDISETPDISENDVSNGLKNIVDCSGAEVEIPVEINRVISVNQPFCGFMTAMGIPDKLIGSHGSVLHHSWAPVFYDGFSEMTLYGYEPAPEAVYEADADLVVLNDALYAEELRNAGIPAICFGYTNKEELFQALDLMGDIFGSPAVEYTQKWEKYLDDVIEEISTEVADIPAEERKNVYYVNAAVGELSEDGIYNTFGGNSFVEYWINTIGANLVTSPYKDVSQLDKEIVLSLNPNVIITSGYLEYQYRDLIKNSPLWKDNTAVKSESIYVMPTSMISYDRFAVELPIMLSYSANLLYPDKHEFNGIEEIDNFYKEYYGKDFSEEELQNMLDGLNPDGTVMGK